MADLSENVLFSWPSVLYNELHFQKKILNTIQITVNGRRDANPSALTKDLNDVVLRADSCGFT